MSPLKRNTNVLLSVMLFTARKPFIGPPALKSQLSNLGFRPYYL
ncbi:hypothetical protein L911_1141 [Vibrio fluvialis I21563]|uniref:Uncharacterized protein n=1 Tax=Vibrio fluvialis PG41 TaxID=1336752 RepID=S7I3Z4_VIBFL|nr:hypothetical protein L910_4784 [Vibrio fluvialis PG41]EPP27926.1 hypothetical protein L911_1141 [Vibrio fluvialis I21563]